MPSRAHVEAVQRVRDLFPNAAAYDTEEFIGDRITDLLHFALTTPYAHELALGEDGSYETREELIDALLDTARRHLDAEYFHPDDISGPLMPKAVAEFLEQT